MFAVESLKRPVWVASGTATNGVTTFGTPVLYNWGWRSLNSGVDMMTFGPEYMDYRKATPPNEEIDNIKRNDRVWMDTTPSDPTDVFAADADFYILGADKGAGGIAAVTFKRLSPDA